MNNIDRLTEQIFNDIFGQQINETLWNVVKAGTTGLLTKGSKDDKDKAKFISILEQYTTKIYKIAKEMVDFARDPKNNTEQTRSIAQAVGQKAQILEVLCTTMYNSPYGKQITKHVDFSKISVEDNPEELTQAQHNDVGRPGIVQQPPTVGKNKYFTFDSKHKITQDTNKNKAWNTAEFGWTQMANRNTGTINPFQGWSLSELMSYVSSGQQAFRSRQDTLDDERNRPVLPDKDGTINKNTKHQEELYRKLLEKWTKEVDHMISDFTYNLRTLHYNLVRFPDIQQLVSTFKAQCTIFVSTRKAEPQTHSPSVTFATANHIERKGSKDKPQRRRDKLRVINFDDGTQTADIWNTIFNPSSPPEKVKEAWVKTLQALNTSIDGFNRFLDKNNWSGIRQRLEPLWRSGDSSHLTDRDKNELHRLLSRYGIELTPPT